MKKTMHMMYGTKCNRKSICKKLLKGAFLVRKYFDNKKMQTMLHLHYVDIKLYACVLSIPCSVIPLQCW